MSSVRLRRILTFVAGLILMPVCLTAAAQDGPLLAGLPDKLPDSVAIPSPGAVSLPTEPPVKRALPVRRLPPIEMSMSLDSAKPSASDPAAGRNSETETVTERYPNGNIKIERQVSLDPQGNYVNHGTYAEYAQNGKLLRSGEFSLGKQHGKWLQYFEDGRGRLFSGKLEQQFVGPFVSEATFADGVLHGSWTIKSHSGKVMDWNFDHGIRDGKSTWWYPKGEKRLEVVYRNGQMDGELLEWSPEGKLISRVPITDGRRLVKKVEWFAPGQKSYEGYYLTAQDVVEPNYDWWNTTAKATPVAQVGQDQKHGLWNAWYSNGKRRIEAHYERDLPVGTFSWWYESGQKQAEGQYQAGIKHGTWTTWHANGLKESKCEYREGALVGKWMRWDPSGKLAESRDFNVEQREDVKRSRASLDNKDLREASRPPKANSSPKPKST
jgi:antitoxin component YwqK of YwqJK toxin-antitoxin module